MRTKGNRVRQVDDNPAEASPDQAWKHVGGVLMAAMSFTAPSKVEETARAWFQHADLGGDMSDREVGAAAEALALALNLALFTPSIRGETAFDRLARSTSRSDADGLAALAAVRAAKFRLLRLEGVDPEGLARLRDLTANETVSVANTEFQDGLIGISVVGWLASFVGGLHVFVGGITPLDDAALTVAMNYVRPGRAGLVAPLRCAETVFRHVVRHGTLEIPGLNRPLDDDDDDEALEPSELDLLALRWAMPGAGRDPDDVQFVRTETAIPAILGMLESAARTHDHGMTALSDAYAAIAQIQLETVHRRTWASSGSVRLDDVAAALEDGIQHGGLSSGARGIFNNLRRKLGTASPSGSHDAELERLIGRIRALRSKTVEHGCTEPEALAAAAKVAELLDRYGLSLSELDISRQTCEGSSVETDRKRSAPIDDCVPATAAFFDCRVWSEKSRSGMLSYVFFGMPADVAAARYLYDLVELAFEAETRQFQSGETYAGTPTGQRRTATNSFQIGLSRGIVTKLQTLRQERESNLRHASGRDLVVMKEGVVEAELAALGLEFKARNRSGGRRVLRDVFEQGRQAGLGFEYTAGIGQSG